MDDIPGSEDANTMEEIVCWIQNRAFALKSRHEHDVPAQILTSLACFGDRYGVQALYNDAVMSIYFMGSMEFKFWNSIFNGTTTHSDTEELELRFNDCARALVSLSKAPAGGCTSKLTKLLADKLIQECYDWPLDKSPESFPGRVEDVVDAEHESDFVRNAIQESRDRLHEILLHDRQPWVKMYLSDKEGEPKFHNRPDHAIVKLQRVSSRKSLNEQSTPFTKDSSPLTATTPSVDTTHLVVIENNVGQDDANACWKGFESVFQADQESAPLGFIAGFVRSHGP